MFTDLIRQTLAGLAILLVMTVVLGVALPRRRVGRRPGASATRPTARRSGVDGKVVGSRLIGQNSRATSGSTPALGQRLRRPGLGPLQPRPAQTPTCSPPSRSARPRSPLRGRRRVAVPADAVTASASGLDPHISPAYAALQVAAWRRPHGLSLDDGPSGSSRSTPTVATSGFLGEPRVNVLELNLARAPLRSRWRLSACTVPMRPRTAAGVPRRRARRRQDLRHARRGHRRASGAPTWSSGTSRPTAGPRTERALEGLEVVPRAQVGYRGTVQEEMDLDAVLERQPDVVLVDELAHTNIPGSTAREALAGRRGPARRGHRGHHHGQHPAPRVAQRRRSSDHRGPAARDRAGPGGAGRRPDRAGRHEPAGAAPPDGPRQHLRRRQGRRRAVAATSARATSRRCASWRCCGSPTGSTRASTATATSTGSTPPGRPASGSSCRSPADPSRAPCMRRAARIASRRSGGEWLALYVTRRDGLDQIAPDRLARCAPRPRSSAAPSTPSSATTRPTRSWSSPAPRTPPRW